MIGTLPATQLAPLDYRCALDAAIGSLGSATPLLICHARELAAEVHQRLPQQSRPGDPAAGLWIEPQTGSWRADLITFARALPINAPLLIVASRPIARLLPERRGWRGSPFGTRMDGLSAEYGFHSVAAIVLNTLSRQAEQRGRPELGDRLHFAARLRYRAAGRQAALCMVALLIASKERG